MLLLVFHSVAEMSEDEMREKALVSARVALDGKPDLERSAILHQHLGSRVMSDMVIETFQPSAGLDQLFTLYDLTPVGQ